MTIGQLPRAFDTTMNQKTLVADFYAGFKGEPEITFIRADATESYLHAWYGYFSRVLEQVEPGSDGAWHGLALHYPLETGWYDESGFEVENVPLLASQLAAIETVFEPTTRRFYDTLVAFVEQAATAHEKVVLEYF
jgi:hypothetical protein